MGDLTGLAPVAGKLRAAGQPEEALGAPDAGPFAVQQVVEAPGVERSARPIDEGGDAVFLGLGRHLAAQGLGPAGSLFRLLHVEQARADHLIQRHGAPHRLKDPGAGIELGHHRLQRPELDRVEQIALVKHDDVGELDLVDQQIGDRALVVLAQMFATGLQSVGRGIVAVDL